MKKIAVAVDGSEQGNKGLAVAIDLAKQLGGTLTVIHAVMPPYIPPEPYGIATAGLEQSLLDYGVSLVNDAAAKAKAAGLDATGKTGMGAPPEVICQIAEAEGAEMIVVGSRGEGAIRQFVLGSVSNRVSHIARIPVLIVH